MYVLNDSLAATVASTDAFGAGFLGFGYAENQFSALNEVVLELVALGACGVAQVIKIRANQSVKGLFEFVDHPSPFAGRFEEFLLFHKCELLRHLDLWNAEKLLQMADAKRPGIQEVEDAESL
jgi:hypothetical protein